MDLRQILFKYRSYTPIPFLLVMIIIANPTITSLIIGFCIVLIGELIRLWGVAIAGSETRTTGMAGGTFLITSGPFAYVRNPLYLGNMILYLGVGIMSNTPIFTLIAFSYFLFQYSLIVNLEEQTLFQKFETDYIKYYKFVPRFFPNFKRYKKEDNIQPELNWKKGLISERRTLQAIGLIVIIQLCLWYLRD